MRLRPTALSQMATTVACAMCGASRGRSCRSKSGGPTLAPHAVRERRHQRLLARRWCGMCLGRGRVFEDRCVADHRHHYCVPCVRLLALIEPAFVPTGCCPYPPGVRQRLRDRIAADQVIRSLRLS